MDGGPNEVFACADLGSFNTGSGFSFGLSGPGFGGLGGGFGGVPLPGCILPGACNVQLPSLSQEINHWLAGPLNDPCIMSPISDLCGLTNGFSQNQDDAHHWLPADFDYGKAAAFDDCLNRQLSMSADIKVAQDLRKEADKRLRDTGGWGITGLSSAAGFLGALLKGAAGLFGGALAAIGPPAAYAGSRSQPYYSLSNQLYKDGFNRAYSSCLNLTGFRP
jgi:hypothetical protein